MPMASKRCSERQRRRKDSLLKKAHEIAKFCDVGVALILRIHTTGEYNTYRSVDRESWPPSTEHIFSYICISGQNIYFKHLHPSTKFVIILQRAQIPLPFLHCLIKEDMKSHSHPPYMYVPVEHLFLQWSFFVQPCLIFSSSSLSDSEV